VNELQVYVHQAFDRMGGVTRRVADDELNVKPFGAGTMSIAALVVHSAAVSEFWLGHVALGRPSDRDRDAEWDAEADRGLLTNLINAAAAQAGADIAAIEAGGGQPHDRRQTLLAGGTDQAIILHVLEECYQHVGHMEITADILENRRAGAAIG